MKKILLITLVLLTTFVVACGPSAPTGPVFDPFVGGTDGISMEFIPGMPPAEDGAILDNGKSAFSVGVKIQNKGEYDFEPTDGDMLNLRLRGILPEQFNVGQSDLEKQLTDPLPGSRKNIDGSTLPGQFTTLSFDDLSYLPDAQGDIPKTFVVDMCYDYMTKSTTPICVASDVTGALTSEDDKAICLLNGMKTTKNSGGPVQINEFKQQPQGGSKITLTFTVSHVGLGEIYEYQGTNVDPCDDSVTNQERNEVMLDISLPDQTSAKISCGSAFTGSDTAISGSVKLFEGNPRIVTCTIEETSGQAGRIYEDLLEVNMYYRYGQSLKKTVNVKDIGSANQ